MIFEAYSGKVNGLLANSNAWLNKRINCSDWRAWQEKETCALISVRVFRFEVLFWEYYQRTGLCIGFQATNMSVS